MKIVVTILDKKFPNAKPLRLPVAKLLVEDALLEGIPNSPEEKKKLNKALTFFLMKKKIEIRLAEPLPADDDPKDAEMRSMMIKLNSARALFNGYGIR
ncbi:MAG: hypothetical protein AB1468_01625 [Candidatus Micrarchaeota archaeon]